MDSDSLLKALFNFVYYRVRTRFPSRLAVVNGEYTVYGPRLLDLWDRDRISDHEVELLTGIETVVEEGDDAVVIGGGLGVSTLATAENVSLAGTVQVFEASGDVVSRLTKTLSVNELSDRVTVTHGAVGPIISVWGGALDAPAIDPATLPECDVLIIDCDGAEGDVLAGLKIRPRHLVVEYHDDLGVSESEARRELDLLGYNVIKHEIELEDRGIGILTAERMKSVRQV